MEKVEDWIDRNTAYLIFGIILFAAVIRIYHLDYQSLWLDELYSIIPADPQKLLSSIIETSKHDQPPFFYLYLHYVFTLFGYNEYVGRLACTFVGMLGIVAIYFLGNECHGKSVGLFASFLTAVSFFHVYYSQELRFYTMTFLLSALSYLFFIRAFKNDRIPDFIFYSVSTVLLLYTHFYGIIIFVSQAIIFLILLRYRRDSRFIVYSVLSGIVIALAFIPWLSVILKWSDVTTIWIERPHPFFVAEYFYEYTGKDAITTVVFVVFIFLFGKWYWGHGTIPNDGRKIGLILILWIVLSYFIPYLRSTYSASLLQPRYTMVTLPAWFILFAIGWNEIRNRWKYILPILIVLSFIVNMMFFKQHYTRIEKDQFREVSEYVISNNVHHYPICSSLPWHLNFYFRNQPEKVEDIHHTDLASIDMFWLLQAHINEQQQAWEDAVLDGKFVVVERHTFFGANALLMKRK